MDCIGHAVYPADIQCTNKMYTIPMYFIKGNSARIELDQFPLKSLRPAQTLLLRRDCNQTAPKSPLYRLGMILL